MSVHYTTVTEEGKIPNTYMTGEVFYKKQTSNIHPENTVIKEVVFQPESRSNWHINSSLQLLIATNGTGYFQEKGQNIRVVYKDEVITILPGVEHWYGATPFKSFSYIAIITEIDKGSGKWLESVTDDEYYSLGNDQDKK